MFAYDYPLLGVFWSLLMFALLMLWIFIVIWAFIDNFRRTDHHGVAKALWFLFIVFVPIVGVVMCRGGGLSQAGPADRRPPHQARMMGAGVCHGSATGLWHCGRQDADIGVQHARLPGAGWAERRRRRR